MKKKTFLFNPSDFTGGTQTFTREEKGAYLELLILQFSQWGLSEDTIRRCFGADYDRLWGFLKAKFTKDADGNFYNKRLRKEMESEGESEETVMVLHKKSTSQTGLMTANKTGLLFAENPEAKVIEIANSTKWIEQICIKQKLDKQLVMSFLSDFLKRECVKSDFLEKSVKDTKDHFINWLAKNKNNVIGKNKQESAIEKF